MSDMQRYFHDFIEKLAIDETNLGRQITEWKECLEGNLCVDFVRKSGSTKRGTNLNSSDVDLVVIFDRGIDTSIPELMFATTAGDIRTCFGDIREMDHGFKYEELDNTTIDIVIGYVDDKNPLVFWIPDKRNGRFVWIETSPDASEKRIKDANRLTSGNAGKYVRIMKYWNIRNKKCFNSFHLETLVIKKILSDSEKFNKISYDEGVHYLYRYLYDAIDRKEPQPSQRGPRLGDMTENQKENIKRILNYSITMSGDALDSEKINDQIGAWECIFGDELTR